MTTVDEAVTPTLLSLHIATDGCNRPIHHAYLHPATVARLRLSCNQAALLKASLGASTAPTLACLAHVWPDAGVPLDRMQLHPATASTFGLASSSAVHVTPLINGPSLTSLPIALKLNILRWLQPVTVQSTLPASTSAAASPSTDGELIASIARQLWGRTVAAGAFTVVSILSQPHLLHIDSVTSASSTSPSLALITPETAVHCSVTTTSPASLGAPASSASDWPAHVIATFPTEARFLHRFLAFNTNTLLTPTTTSPALLICGGHGTGKSALLSVVGSEGYGADSAAQLFVRRLRCGEIIASSGAGAERSNVLSEAWDECVRKRKQRGSAVLVIDDVTPLLTTNNFPSLSSQLLALLDSASSTPAAPSATPLLVAACDDGQPIASHWLRAGRFDEQLHMRPLAATQRQRALEWLVARSGMETDSTHLERVASRMHGSTVRQLVNVCLYVTLLWAEESLGGETQAEGRNRAVSWKKWETAIQTVAAPATSSLLTPAQAVSAPSPQPTAADPFPLVGGYGALKKHLLLLIQSFLRPVQQHATRTLVTSARPTGILLHGPSGCGKSLLVSSLAALSASPCVIVGTPFGVVRLHVASLLSPYLGESERQLRAVFEQAKANAPCLLLVDDVDALIGSRGDAGEGGGGEEEGGATRLLTTLLVLLDGIDSSSTASPVLVVATACSPAALDSALLRPGRLSNQLLVTLPTAEDRRQIVQRVAEVDGVLWGSDEGGVEWEEVVRRTRGCSGAELCGLVRQSVWIAWREQKSGKKHEQQHPAQRVEMRHLRQAMGATGCLD